MTRTDEMRVGDAERDAVTTALHEHFAAGRLDREELDERLGTTLAAKTQGDLKAIVRDLPGPSGLPEPARTPVPGHWAYAHGHHLRHHRHGHHHRFPAFPLMIGLFAFLAVAAGPATAMLAVLQFAVLVWIVRAVLFAVRAGRPRPR
ncbi:DUF1707 domain-containing protein [Actinomadura sp. 21ATH]|uniref:DUF1707 SHOCT-like domain-containing protein n=1 Tax=Actinomadura sp. 21ATH TaxID=1735444 RepID=UPI0035C00CBD